MSPTQEAVFQSGSGVAPDTLLAAIAASVLVLAFVWVIWITLGTFRAWIWATLRSHPQIHQTGQTLLVRQLAPNAQGVPIEIYCFSKDTAWISYEDIQADLFDRILAMVPEFGLRVFQEPAGSDLAQWRGDPTCDVAPPDDAEGA